MTTLAASLNREMRTFAVELFERSGAIADWPAPDRPGTVMAPHDMAEAAGLPGEEFSLASTVAPGALHVSLGSEFLDVAARTLDVAVPRDGAFRIPERYLTSRNLAADVPKTFAWQNARAKYGAAEPVLVDYHLWTLHAMLRSEDVWEGLFNIAINARTLATVELPDVFHEPDVAGDARPPATDDSSTYAAAVAEGKRRLVAASADFVRRIEQRLERDRKRLQDYYRALSREAEGAKHRPAAPSAEDVAAKKRAVDIELRRKLAELNENYAIGAALRPVVLARVRLPALSLPVTIQRKQAVREYRLYWNSLIKGFEPLACSRCRRATFSATFANETVDLLCTPCAERK